MNEYPRRHEPKPALGITEEVSRQLDRLHLARATALLLDASRLEEGLPTEIGVVRSVTSLADALQRLQEETEGAEEA